MRFRITVEVTRHKEPTVVQCDHDDKPRPPMVDVKGAHSIERAPQWDYDTAPRVAGFTIGCQP